MFAPTQEVYSLLAHSLLFDTLSDKELRQLFNDASLRHFAAGTIMPMDRELSESIFVVVSGELRLFVVAADHKRELTIAHRYAGDIITALDDSYLFVQAKQTTETLQISERSLQILLGSGTAQNLLRLHKQHTQELLTVIRQLAFQKLRGRLAAYLVQHAPSVPCPLASNTAIAAELATVPEVVSRQLTAFQKENLLSLENRDITKIDTRGLLALAQEY